MNNKDIFYYKFWYFTSFLGNVWSVSTDFHTESQAFISWSKFTLSSSLSLRSNISGVKPRQLVCRLDMRSVSMSFSPAEIKAKSTRTLSSWVAVKQKISNDVHYFSRLTLKWVILPVCIIQAKINIFLRRGKHKSLLNVRKAGEIRGSNLGDRLWQRRVVVIRLVFPFQTLRPLTTACLNLHLIVERNHSTSRLLSTTALRHWALLKSKHWRAWLAFA